LGQNEGREEKGISLLLVLSFFLLSSFISFSLTGCGGGGGGSSSASDGPIGPALFSGWEMTNGPFSGSISSLTVDPTDSGILYSITQKSEVYKSTDGGLSWTYFSTTDTTTQENIRAQQLEIAATDNQLFYLGTGSQGMYKSTDGGYTWVHTSNGLPENQYGYLSVDKIIIDPTPTNHDIVYVRLDMGYMIYKTINGGQNWVMINDQTADLTPVQDLLIYPHDNQTLYIGLWHYVSSQPHPEKGGTWKATNGGLNWLQISGTCPWCLPKDIYGNWVRVNELAMGSQGSPRLYAGTDYCLCGSDDGGENWGMIEIVGIPVQDHQRITALEIDPNDDKTIYVGVQDEDNWNLSGLWVTTDGGVNWTQAADFKGTRVWAIEICPGDSTVFVHVGGGWHRRGSSAQQWEQVNFDGIADVRVSALSRVLLPNRGFIYAGTEFGVYHTQDGGENWYSRGLEDQYIYALVMDLNNTQKVLVGTMDGVYKTVDGGENWVEKNNGLTAWGAFTLAMDPADSDILYVGTTDGIFKTLDGGENWVEKGEFPFSDNFVWRLAIARYDPLVLYASVEDWFGTERKIYKSINGGESWQDVSGNLPTDMEVWGISISPADSNVVYIGTNGYGIYKTVDGGTTWELKNSGLTSTKIISLAISQWYDEIVFAGTDDEGVFTTVDGGENWHNLDDGLNSPLSKRICSLSMDLRDPDDPVVYAGTGCGVFKAYK
jgi:photosystem II stability/assembly factor-like uncharacterized protein